MIKLDRLRFYSDVTFCGMKLALYELKWALVYGHKGWLAVILLTQKPSGNLNLESRWVTIEKPSSLSLTLSMRPEKTQYVGVDEGDREVGDSFCSPLFTTYRGQRTGALSGWRCLKGITCLHQVLVGGCWPDDVRGKTACSDCTVHGVGWTRKVINVSHDYSYLEPTHGNTSHWLS